MARPLKGIIMLQSNHNYEGHSLNKYTKPCSNVGNVYDIHVSEEGECKPHSFRIFCFVSSFLVSLLACLAAIECVLLPPYGPVIELNFPLPCHGKSCKFG